MSTIELVNDIQVAVIGSSTGIIEIPGQSIVTQEGSSIDVIDSGSSIVLEGASEVIEIPSQTILIHEVGMQGPSGIGGGGGTPGGADSEVQYNKAGAFAGEAAFNYNDSADLLSVPNITASGNIAANTAFVSSLTANRAVVSSAFDQLVSSATTATELGYVSGVTSSIQTQLNAKGDITSVGNVASGAAFDGSQDSWLLTFLRSGQTGTLTWDGAGSAFRFNNPNTNTVAQVVGNASAELEDLLTLFASVNITSAGYSSDETAILFAESKGNALGGSIIGGIYNPGAQPVIGDVFTNFVGAGYSTVGGGTLPAAAQIALRAPASWTGTSTPGEIAFGTMNVGEIDPLVPVDRIVVRSDGTMDFIGYGNSINAKLTWDDSDSPYAVAKNQMRLEASSEGTSFVVGSPSPILGLFLDIFPTLGPTSVEGVSGELGVILCESRTGLGDLGGLLLTGAYTDTGLSPNADQPLFTNIIFGGDGAGGIYTSAPMRVVATEDWSLGSYGTRVEFNLGVTGTAGESPAFYLSGTDGATFNPNNETFFDFLVKSATLDIFKVDSSADAIGFFGVTPVVRQTGGAATADLTYSSNERDMLNALWTAMRNYGLLT
jgi:hypothetical protein